ncbi:NaeI family type II restriction endonuclease [Jatrophihabitans sp. YIM 134969]
MTSWLLAKPDLVELIGDAIEDSVYYVLDSARTGRFDLYDEAVDSDERRTVGTKLQYHLIDNFELMKSRHPDTHIEGVGVEIKGTTRDNWAIPKEGHCGVTLLVKVDARQWRHQAFMMRAHRVWLRPGKNGDGKRGVATQALEDYAIDLFGWRTLRPNPLRDLTVSQLAIVFGSGGQESRFAELFRFAPRTVIQRGVLMTVGADRADPMRRVRATRKRIYPDGLALLCGKFPEQRQLASLMDFDLAGAAWVAVRWDEILGHGSLSDKVIRAISADL